ncbi:lamin tail domain-containing protein [Mycoplasmatota bacterium]|nr:lamin tail domain-containing protein [Mycoplasmatota bacterium]
MKKVFLLAMFMMSFLTLAACGSKETYVVISKVFDAKSQANNVIELYNTSSEDIALSDYTLRFYSNGEESYSKEINLSRTIEANEYYAVGSVNVLNDDIEDEFDFIYEDGSLPFNGDDVIELAYKDEASDRVGTIGADFMYGRDLTLIRLGELSTFKPTTDYDLFDFINYIPDAFQYLKNNDYEIKTLEDIYAGPQLEDRFKSMSYVSEDDSNLGGGGVVLTTVENIADGDTATFTASGDFEGGGSLRYYYIDTPEVNGAYVDAAPWGYVASKYNKQYLLNDANDKEIYIQSIPNTSIDEGYGRYLGLVWVNGYLSQFLITSEGLTSSVPISYEAYDYILTYKNVPYLTFLRFAEQRAKENSWGMHGYPTDPDGEKAPDWNYSSNTYTTQDPVWEPHLELPWA